MSVLRNARIVLGVTGGIAAYKAADLASKLSQAGAVVDVILTEAGRRFVGEATFEALTKRPVFGHVFVPWRDGFYGHITLGHDAHALVVVPATADAIARLAHGEAGDMLGAVALSTTAALVVVPAMEHTMYHHPATQANLALLRERGMTQVGPERGRLASGDEGDGRMSSVETILGATRLVLGRRGLLAGRRVVVTAGGTQEPLDPVRYLGNRSSGRMGYAVAQAAVDAGAQVTLITGPTFLSPPYGAAVERITTAEEMLAAVRRAVEKADALVMPAAVADYRPAERRRAKIKKDRDGGMQLCLVRNPDILSSIDRPGLVKIGFAAETDNLLSNARGKLEAKRLDMIVANDAEASIGSNSSTATILTPDGGTEALPAMSKEELAAILIQRLGRKIGGESVG